MHSAGMVRMRAQLGALEVHLACMCMHSSTCVEGATDMHSQGAQSMHHRPCIDDVRIAGMARSHAQLEARCAPSWHVPSACIEGMAYMYSRPVHRVCTAGYA